MKSQAQVVVIGGGVVGTSVLYHLTKKGWRDVVLLERLELTAGSTWHAAGGMHTVNGDPNVAKLQQYTINLYKEIEEVSGQSVGLHMTEGLMLAATPERWEWLQAIRSKGRYLGMQVELVSLDEAEKLLPLIDKRQFTGAMYDPIQGHVDPYGTTHAFASSAKKGGAEVHVHTRVLETRPRPDGTWDVITDKGTIHAEHVVNAGGLWAREVGRMVGIELPVLAMEHQYLITEDMPEVAEINKTTGKMVLHAVDFDGEIYMRQERGGMLLGTYEKHGIPWSPKDTPWDFGPTLLPDDMDRMADNLEVGFRHFPAFQKAGIKKIINGPFTFAPDGNPLVGPIRGLRNYWVACGVMAGFSQGGGVGLALANWMVDGDPGMDVWAMDVARFGDWASRAYTNTKVRENYGRRFRVRFPNEELPAARPLRTTPMYHKWLELGAVMGDNWALEAPLWFAPKGVKDEFSFHRSTDFAHVKAECQAVRTGVGISETSTFAKYEVTGPDAETWLSHLLANKMPKEGRLSLSPMLNHAGKLIGDFTVAKAAPERFYIFGSGAAEKYHMRWFEQQLRSWSGESGTGGIESAAVDDAPTLLPLGEGGAQRRMRGTGGSAPAELAPRDPAATTSARADGLAPSSALRAPSPNGRRQGGAGSSGSSVIAAADGSVRVAALGQALAGLSIAGPRSRDLLAKLTDDDISAKAFRFMDFRPHMDIGLVPAMVGRITFTGDLGFEMWVKPEYQVGLFTALWEAGQDFGIRPFGSRALLSLAREKNFGTWAREFRPIYGPFEADLGRFVDLAKNDFIGRDGAKKEKDQGPARSRVSFVVDATDADAIGDEAVWKDGKVVGWITSGGYCHHVGCSLAIGYVPTETIANGADKAKWEVEILGDRRPAKLQLEPLFDPKAERMRG